MASCISKDLISLYDDECSHGRFANDGINDDRFNDRPEAMVSLLPDPMVFSISTHTMMAESQIFRLRRALVAYINNTRRGILCG